NSTSHLIVLFLHTRPTPEFYTLSLHDALPIWKVGREGLGGGKQQARACEPGAAHRKARHGVCLLAGLASEAARAWQRLRSRTIRSEEHTSELQSRGHLVCRLLREKKKIVQINI